MNLKKRNLAISVCLALSAYATQVSAADLWSGSFSDRGVDYTLTFESQVGNVGTFELSLVTSGYSGSNGAYLDSVSLRAWDGGSAAMSFVLLSGPAATGWSPAEGSISSGPVASAGCGTEGAGFACVEAMTKGVLGVGNGTLVNPYVFRFEVTADSFLSSYAGAHVGAGYANYLGDGRSYGITSYTMTTPVPEPEVYAMMIAGLGLMGFVARRRKTV